MSRRNQSGLGSIDWMTFSLYLSLIGVGWLMIYTVGYGEEGYPTSRVDFLMDTTVGKQTIFMGISAVLLLFTLIIDWKFWRTFAYLIYGATLAFLLAVLLFGKEIKGATSWFALPGGLTLQPSEFAKFGACLAMAAFLSTYSTNLRERRSQLTALGLMLAPMVLILLQPDAGSALIFTSFLIVLYREGMPSLPYAMALSIIALLILSLSFNPNYVIIGLLQVGLLGLIANLKKYQWYGFGALAVLVAGSIVAIQNGFFLYTFITNLVLLAGLSVFMWMDRQERIALLSFGSVGIGTLLVLSTSYAFNNFLKPHQQDRINVWLNPSKCDPQGSLYNLLQSKAAITSGGIQGKGFLQGNMTKLNYVPEQATDFIFCTVGEEQGFIGSFAIIALFLILMLRITIVAERQRSNFSRQYAYGVAGILFIHFLINIGMTMGFMPIIGIPLPFISYGGSSLMGFTLMIGVLLKLDSHRYSV